MILIQIQLNFIPKKWKLKLNQLRNTSDDINSNIIDFIRITCKFKLNQLRNTSDDINSNIIDFIRITCKFNLNQMRNTSYDINYFNKMSITDNDFSKTCLSN